MQVKSLTIENKKEDRENIQREKEFKKKVYNLELKKNQNVDCKGK